MMLSSIDTKRGARQGHVGVSSDRRASGFCAASDCQRLHGFARRSPLDQLVNNTGSRAGSRYYSHLAASSGQSHSTADRPRPVLNPSRHFFLRSTPIYHAVVVARVGPTTPKSIDPRLLPSIRPKRAARLPLAREHLERRKGDGNGTQLVLDSQAFVATGPLRASLRRHCPTTPTRARAPTRVFREEADPTATPPHATGMIAVVPVLFFSDNCH